MRILVTGGTGFMGTHTVRALADAGHEVLTASRARSGPPGAASHVRHDFSQPDPFPDVGRLDAIVHLAGNASALAARADPAAVARTNTQGTLVALEVARRSDAVFLLASTQRIYQTGPRRRVEDAPKIPTEPYGYTKLAAELFVEMAGRVFGMRGAVLRFFSVYGPGQLIPVGDSGVVAIFGQQALAGKPLMVMSHQRKDFVDVADSVDAIQLALQRASSPPRAYNIATGVPTSVLDLARAIVQIAGSSSEIVEDYSQGDPGGLVADIRRARRELGYQPRVGLEEGLDRYVRWLRAAGAHPA